MVLTDLYLRQEVGEVKQAIDINRMNVPDAIIMQIQKSKLGMA